MDTVTNVNKSTFSYMTILNAWQFDDSRKTAGCEACKYFKVDIIIDNQRIDTLYFKDLCPAV